jgi:hypothetical protein
LSVRRQANHPNLCDPERKPLPQNRAGAYCPTHVGRIYGWQYGAFILASGLVREEN